MRSGLRLDLHEMGPGLMLAAMLALAMPVMAQTDTNAPPAAQTAANWLDFVSHGSNFVVAPYGIVTTDKKLHGGGAGLALGYKVTDLLVPVMRIDYLNKAFYQGSLTLELQARITLHTNFTLVPFGIAGGAVPFGGGSGGNGATAQGIVGAGVALRLDFMDGIGKKMDLLADWEKWSAIDGSQYRFGLAYKFW